MAQSAWSAARSYGLKTSLLSAEPRLEFSEVAVAFAILLENPFGLPLQQPEGFAPLLSSPCEQISYRFLRRGRIKPVTGPSDHVIESSTDQIGTRCAERRLRNLAVSSEPSLIADRRETAATGKRLSVPLHRTVSVAPRVDHHRYRPYGTDFRSSRVAGVVYQTNTLRTQDKSRIHPTATARS